MRDPDPRKQSPRQIRPQRKELAFTSPRHVLGGALALGLVMVAPLGLMASQCSNSVLPERSGIEMVSSPIISPAESDFGYRPHPATA